MIEIEVRSIVCKFQSPQNPLMRIYLIDEQAVIKQVNALAGLNDLYYFNY